ncbi:MAG: molecular chaperone DnaJ, partial [Proteobacteria bacterium]|nr:molecular chaperone DnaJ [Pseudomonadota bacterium]
GEGEPGSGGGPNGDLYVQIAIEPHPIFERQESELFCEVPLSYSAAALGGELSIPTLEGESALKIPPGTESGKIFKLKGKGVPVLGSNRRGDLHVRVKIHVPKKVSEKQRELLEKLQAIDERSIGDENKGFFDKVKQMFG